MTDTPFNAKNGIVANGSFSANSTQVVFPNTAVLIANGSAGSTGQALTSNGSGLYWSTPVVFSNSIGYTWSNVQTFAANNTVFGSNNGSQSTEYISIYANTANGIGLYTNTGTAINIVSNNGIGVYAYSNNVAISGVSTNSQGIRGVSTSSHGVIGTSTTSTGVRGVSNSWFGVYGISNTNIGVYGISTSYIGIYGVSNTNVGTYGISSSGYGIAGVSNTAPGGYFQSVGSNIVLFANNGGIASYVDLAGNFQGTSNNALYLANVAASSYLLANGVSSNVAAYLPNYGGIVNASSYSIGSSFVANTINISLGSSFVANSTGVYDNIGSVRSIPILSKSGAYQIGPSDNGQTISITTGGITVNGAILSVGQAFSIFNNSNTTQTITQGSGATIYLAGFGTTGNRTLSQYGLASIIMIASNTFVISGAGLG
jgi:hypothetical protein